MLGLCGDNREAHASFESDGMQAQIDAVSDFKNASAMRKHRYRDMLTAFLMLVAIMLLQAYLNIDGVLTALVGVLSGAVIAYFGLGAYADGKDKTDR